MGGSGHAEARVGVRRRVFRGAEGHAEARVRGAPRRGLLAAGRKGRAGDGGEGAWGEAVA